MHTPEETWRKAILPVDATIEDAVRNLNQIALKIVMIVSDEGILQGTISDGDIRRGLLGGLNLNSPILKVIHRDALVVTPEISQDLVKKLMVANSIQQIPIVNEGREIIGLHLWNEIISPNSRENLMVIMAGGKGVRLRPHTENCPKPLLPVAGKPMLEHIIERAKLEGFGHFIISVHYLGEMIQSYFGDGKRHGVKIEYLNERDPLGTAGALSLLKLRPKRPLIITNGDIISDIGYGEILDFHVRYKPVATMAVRTYEWQNPFGVVLTNGIDITSFEEKPIVRSRINAGIYVLEPEALEFLVPDSYCDMPTLFERIHSKGMRTVVYPMHEPWLDVGRLDDLVAANKFRNV